MAGAAGRTMGTHKPLILPWLVSQLDQGRLEGVAWLDKGRTRFRIPWKHGLRQDAQQKDFGIFQAWAEASGAYTPGRDNPDLPTWKRNFRSALNRKEVLRLVDDRSKDPQDPHKVYEFLTPAWEFEVTAFYRGRQVFQQTVFCPEGLRLVEPEAADGTLPGQPIRLPDPGVYLTDRDVMSLVKRVLSNLGGGLAIWRAGQQLWAQRLGHSHVYWAMGEELLPDSHGPSGEVPKDKEGGVFDLGPFVADLIAFLGGSRRSPHYTLWFCLGESWPQDQPWTKRLVMVKVVPRDYNSQKPTWKLQLPRVFVTTSSLPPGASGCPSHDLTPRSCFELLKLCGSRGTTSPNSLCEELQLPGILTPNCSALPSGNPTNSLSPGNLL
nr:interferon regulatory factor 3 isoform X6 [Equus asinus]